MTYFAHYSVLKQECISYLFDNWKDSPASELLFADFTFGGGGHSLALLECDSRIKLLATDQDGEAIANGSRLIGEKQLSDRIRLLPFNFEKFPQWFCENMGGKKLNGVLMDLGVSSHHFDKTERGFSFRGDAELDMRMDTTSDYPSARDLINSCEEEELARIFFEYGEERLSRKIAAKIVEARRIKPITRTSELENIIFHAYPASQRYGRAHPATRSFQALRIAVNRELDILEKIIPDAFDLLVPQGRMAIISFHSLEDRIVKNSFKKLQHNENSCKIITKKPLIPGEVELRENSRSRSAKLRIIEKS